MLEKLVPIGFFLIFLGFSLVVAGVVAGSFGQGREVEAKTGGVLLIGPLPIVFGNDRDAVIGALVLAVVFMALLFFIFNHKQVGF